MVAGKLLKVGPSKIRAESTKVVLMRKADARVRIADDSQASIEEFKGTYLRSHPTFKRLAP